MSSKPQFVLPFTSEAELDILRRASQIALDYQGNVRVEIKSDETLVTQADRAVEAFLKRELSELAPGWSFLGEEGGLSGDPDAPCWVIDPIDGTTNYTKGIPLWVNSVGAVHQGRPVFGMIAVPEQNEILWAAEGAGAWHIKGGQTKRLRVRDSLPLEQEDLIACNTTVERVLDFSQVPCRLRNFGALAYHLAALSRGSLVANIAHYHKLYDVAAGLCICFEAGCEAKYLDGSTWRAVVSSESEKQPMFCAPPHVLGELLSRLTPKLVSEVTKADQEIETALDS